MSLIVPKLGQAIAELAPSYPGVDGVAVDGRCSAGHRETSARRG